MLDTIFQYYSPDIQQVRPLGVLTLWQLLKSIESPKGDMRKTFELLRTTDDKALRSELKKKLFALTPAVVVGEKRAYAHIKHFTGLMPIDFDNLSTDEAQNIKTHLTKECPFTIAIWLSPSGAGVRALVKIPIVQTVEQYKELFHGFERSCFGGFKGFDIAPQNPVLPMFLSYDPQIQVIHPDDVKTWESTYKPKPTQPKITYKSDDLSGKVYNIISKIIDNIDDNGHPQVRAASYALGGYVGAGYIGYNSAINMIDQLIDSNHYLTTKHSSSTGYKKTAKQMIDKGFNFPLTL